jgi:pimeloyl-ACP methyl ester carboxylesterase
MLREEHTGITVPVAVMAPESIAAPAALVVISHGNGGSGVIYRTLATALVRAGCVVALPDHPGNTRGDNGLAGTELNREQRPRHVALVIDWCLGASPFAASLSGAVALIGHSLGGFTALALAATDERVRALVLLAPATFWLLESGVLANVRVPILMITAEHDAYTPPFHAEIVQRGLPDAGLLEHHVIAGAGHFSFLDPFPATLTRPEFAPSQDPPGFDRAGFLAVLGPQVVAFLQRVL